MPRINPTVTKQAEDIYNDLPHHKRGDFVSDAIVEKHEHDTGTGIEVRVAELERKVNELEERRF